jgi:hypothetical protein
MRFVRLKGSFGVQCLRIANANESDSPTGRAGTGRIHNDNRGQALISEGLSPFHSHLSRTAFSIEEMAPVCYTPAAF